MINNRILRYDLTTFNFQKTHYQRLQFNSQVIDFKSEICDSLRYINIDYLTNFISFSWIFLSSDNFHITSFYLLHKFLILRSECDRLCQEF